MKRFTNRVTRDLGQIADRATPSPTAWEKIQQRIDEQTDEPTMEVIMLDPDRKPSTTRPKPWLMVTAAAAAVLIIVGIVVAASGSDDEGGQVTTVDPEPTPAPTENPEVERLPAEGALSGLCQTGSGVENAETGRVESNQRCTFNVADDPPFPEVAAARLTRSTSERGEPALLTGGDGSGFALAGYEASGPFRGVGIAPGVGAYEGETIHLLLRATGVDRIAVVWQLDDGPLPEPETGPDQIVAEVSFTCVLTFLDEDGGVAAYDQTCTYGGDDARLVPEPETFRVTVDERDPFLDPTGGIAFISAVSDNGTLRSGLVDGDVVRLRGTRAGAGELEGRLIDEIAWGTDDGAGTTTGTIWMTALAPNP